MKTLLLVVATLVVAILFIQLLHAEPGGLLIQFGAWQVETSAVALALASIILLLLLLALVKIFSLFFSIPGRVRQQGQSGRRSRTQKHLLQGFIAFTEGRWQKAEKQLLQLETDTDTNFINYLVAARTSNALSDYQRRDEWLEKAVQASPRAAVAVDITRAELQLEQRDYDNALQTLQFLRRSAPANARVVKWLAQLYHFRGNWPELNELLPVARRLNVLNHTELDALQSDCWHGLLNHCTQEQLARTWQRLPKSARQDPALIEVQVRRLVDAQQTAAAEKILREHLSRHWSEALLPHYAQLAIEDAERKLEAAEKWLPAHPESASLLLLLGQLCLRCKLWGKARSYLESGYALQPNARCAYELANLLAQLGEPEKAAEYTANGLQLALEQGQPEIASISSTIGNSAELDTAPPSKLLPQAPPP